MRLAEQVAPDHGALRHVQPVALARERLLPVLPALAELLPEPGLRRGSVLAVRGVAATSLAFALAAGPSAEGSWMVAVGCSALGLLAAAELGVALGRVVLVAPPDRAEWATVVATALDGFDVVLVSSALRLRTGELRRLQARARDRGAVVVVLGPEPAGWEPEVVVQGATVRWEGLGEGHGHLRARRVTVQVEGRRVGGRTRREVLWLPDPEGRVRLDEPGAPVVPLRAS